MPSNYDNELGIELQAAGENLNTWGQPKLNNALTRLVKAEAGYISKALTGNVTLTSSNTSTDPNDYEARHGTIRFTGTGAFVVTVPSSPKPYIIWNACTGALTLTTGAGATVDVAPGEICGVLSNGSDVVKVKVTNYGSDLITTSGSPTLPGHLTNKAYVDGLAFGAVNLPGQNPATEGQYVRSNGTVAGWSTIQVGEVEGAAPSANPTLTGTLTAEDAEVSNNLTVGGDVTIDGSLTINGTPGFPKYLSSGSASAAATVDMALSGSFKEYWIHIRDLRGSVAGSVLGVLSFDSAASYKTAADDYLYESFTQGNSSFTNGPVAQGAAMVLGDSVVNTGTGGMDLFIRVVTQAGRETRLSSDWGQIASGSATDCKSGRHTAGTNGKGYGKATHLRLTVNSGNATCDYAVYGIT